MLFGFVAALGKDFRLLLRDRVGLVFMTLAPVVVITVAGLSLANLYDVTGGPPPSCCRWSTRTVAASGARSPSGCVTIGPCA